MGFFDAIILGIIQGLTEFLPVSSSGHLAIIKNFMNIEAESALYDVLLHVATLVAICIVMRKDILKLILEFVDMVKDIGCNIGFFFKNMSGNKEPYYQVLSTPYRRFVALIIVSSIPTAIIGFLLNDIIETVEGELLIPGICLIATAVIIFISDFVSEGTKKAKDASVLDAFAIGTAQGVATLPGLSRSGTTITACLICGFDRKFAVKYSFIMSIPAIFGALLLKITKIGAEGPSVVTVLFYIVGMIVAGVVGYFALIFTVKLVQKKSFKFFAIYCFGIGVVSVITYLIR